MCSAATWLLAPSHPALLSLQVLAEQHLPADGAGLLPERGGAALLRGAVQRLPAGAGGAQAAPAADTRGQQLEEDVQGAGQPAGEGLHHRAGPQLRAGPHLGPHQRHLHLRPRPLHLHCAELAARSVCSCDSSQLLSKGKG